MQEGISELLNRALTGDKTAENKLFSSLSARFLLIAQHRIGNPQKDSDEITRNAEDIVQETLEILFRDYKQVEFSAGFLQYAFGILRNKIGDYFRKKEREEVMNIPLEAGRFVNSEQLENVIDANELREFIIKSLVKLNFESQRIIYALMEGYSAGGMIGILGKIPRGTLDNKIYRVRKELKKLLLKEGYYE
jgi:RNA polymerase sigma factor (sigma-70 family)